MAVSAESVPAAGLPAPAPVLVYLYGPPASGKLTVAEQLARLSGYPLFHNHLTVNAVRSVFPFGSAPFTDVLHRVRLDVFETAARSGISLIFTNNSAWGGADGYSRFCAFAAQTRYVFETGGGRVRFVRVTAPQAILEERLDEESRREHGKLLEINRLRELTDGLDQTSLHPDDLVIDTSQMSPRDAALTVFETLMT